MRSLLLFLRSGVALAGLGLAASCSTPAGHEFAAASVAAPAEAARRVDAPLLESSPEPPADLGTMLAPLAHAARIPGMAAAVISGGRIVAHGVTGVRRRGFSDPITREDHFHIASCAKALSATLVARLVEEGALAWDQPIPAYFSNATLHPGWEKVTLRHLLTHTAGVRDPLLALFTSTYFGRGNLTEQRSALVQRVLRSAPATAPGGESVYGNMGFIILAAAAESATGMAWEHLMRERVFAPLGLSTAGFGPPGEAGEMRQPWGHGKRRVLQLGVAGNAAFDPGSRGAEYPALASPAGYVHLSLHDWATFVALHLRLHPANPQRSITMLQPDTADMLHALRPGAAYSAGWFVATRPWAQGARPQDVGRVLYHHGNNGRWTSAVWVAPEVDFAVLVTCNRGDMSAALDEVVGQLVRHYAPRR